MLCILPLFHIFSLRAGSAILGMHKLKTGSLLDLVQRFKVTVALVVPLIVPAFTKNTLEGGYDLLPIQIVMASVAPL